jgi:hypothetical protein
MKHVLQSQPSARNISQRQKDQQAELKLHRQKTKAQSSERFVGLDVWLHYYNWQSGNVELIMQSKPARDRQKASYDQNAREALADCEQEVYDMIEYCHKRVDKLVGWDAVFVTDLHIKLLHYPLSPEQFEQLFRIFHALCAFEPHKPQIEPPQRPKRTIIHYRDYDDLHRTLDVTDLSDEEVDVIHESIRTNRVDHGRLLVFVQHLREACRRRMQYADDDIPF